MRIVITCGPAIAPIDDVRRITNFSTGELGIRLANALAAAGHEAICLKGEAATSPLAFAPEVDARAFSTNDDLAAQLEEIIGVGVVFHAAALCDYEIGDVRDASGTLRRDAKIPSRIGELVLRLKPARKVLPLLRHIYPGARIAGWKYELNGSCADVLTAGSAQILEARSDLCVVNGTAYGSGFGLLQPDGRIVHAVDKSALCVALVEWCKVSFGQ